jgi:hypothetical protein
MRAPVMVASHAAAIDGDPPREWHADQLRLMR